LTFAWYGFSLEHPEEWAPVTLSGGRKEGYVRIASPSRQSLQVRWKATKPGVDLAGVLHTYLERLADDAKAAKVPFRSEVDDSEPRITYRYASTLHGRGMIFHSEPSGRVFFLEAVSSKNDSLLPAFRRLADSFTADTETERWALYGLKLKLPSGLDVDKKVLESGRTQLFLSTKKAQIEAQRWAFAEQLVAKHGLENWARAMFQLPKSASEVTAEGVQFVQPGSLLKAAVTAMATVQADRNQIATIKVSTREEGWRPAWDWFE
jgi:hypothetical protein